MPQQRRCRFAFREQLGVFLGGIHADSRKRNRNLRNVIAVNNQIPVLPKSRPDFISLIGGKQRGFKVAVREIMGNKLDFIQQARG
jgi:hypothetical protein